MSTWRLNKKFEVVMIAEEGEKESMECFVSWESSDLPAKDPV